MDINGFVSYLKSIIFTTSIYISDLVGLVREVLDNWVLIFSDLIAVVSAYINSELYILTDISSLYLFYYLEKVFNYKDLIFLILVIYCIVSIIAYSLYYGVIFFKLFGSFVKGSIKIEYPTKEKKVVGIFEIRKYLYNNLDAYFSTAMLNILLDIEERTAGHLPSEADYRRVISDFIYSSVISKPFRNVYSFVKKNVVKDRVQSSYIDNISENIEIDAIENRDIISKLSGILEFGDGVIPIESWDEVIDKVLKRFESQVISNLLLVSPKSLGKSSFIKYFTTKIGNISLQHIIGSEIDDIEEDPYIANLIDITQINKQIIIVDDIEYFFKRTVGGFERLEKLFVIMEKTKSRVLWLMSCNDIFYSYIRHILPVESMFSIIYDFKDINAAKIQGIFDGIFKKTGLTYRIIPEKKVKDDIANQIRTKKIHTRDVEGYIRTQYFKKLIEVCGKDIEACMQSFLRSVKDMRSQRIYAEFPTYIEYSYINKLSIDGILIIYYIALHKAMSKNDIMDTLLFSSQNVSLQLSLLMENGIIEKVGKRFCISSGAYSQVIKMLLSKNIMG